MQKILVAAGALAAIGYLAYRAMYQTHQTISEDMPKDIAERQASAPKQQLDNVRTKAKDIEAKDQEYTDKIADETKSP